VRRRWRVRVHGCVLLVVALTSAAACGQGVHGGGDRSDFTLAMAPTPGRPEMSIMFPEPRAQSAGSVDTRETDEDDPYPDTAPSLTLDHVGAKPNDWEFRLAPYLWLLSVSADIETGPISTRADACVTDLLQNLDLMAQLRFEALHRQRWGFFLDGTYIGLSTEARANIGPFKFRGRDVDAELRLAWLDFGGMYRFGESGKCFDAFFGGRYAHVSTDVSLGRLLDSGNDSDFVSPIIGGRVEWAFNERWGGSLKGEVGGFGVGQGADLYWGATAAVGYRFSEHTTFEIGYRLHDWNYGEGRRDLDLMFHGPIVGLVFRF
jgi:hypothetical protein